MFAEIKKVQKQLNEMGYQAGPADGLWGNKTENAVKLLLSDNNLKWDGAFDQNEIKLIEKIFLKNGFKGNPKLGVNSSTSTDRISRNFCKFIKPSDKLVNQIGNINTYLNSYFMSVSPIELFDINEKTVSSSGKEILLENLNNKNKLHFEKGIFVDVGGDGANLSGANLSFSNLEDADLSDADLTGANLQNVNIDASKLCRTITPWGEDNSGC